MDGPVVEIDDQPIAATFFNENRWLSSFITPDAADIEVLYNKLTVGLDNVVDKITACWEWVANEVKYVHFVKAKTWIEGKVSVQNDYWMEPTTTIHIRRGNCAVKSFLLTSLLRHALPPNQVYCALGNLYNGKPGGHAWVNVELGQSYIIEPTTNQVPCLIPSIATQRYEAVHYFNDKEVKAVEGRTQLVPFSRCYSTWLEDYLNWSYINGGR